ncbi:peptide chain release factor N(5)-glutamine methyltransferase [Jannaschia sp. S6380]|uniref:peptide chain release factor N(5)-glutamine methyltransferase n=1 Tax=Jannaschia sp. S6380 TaxID=2926408 RepID=UPI001FF3E07E|nr:peptide chain release factor N(5)-glutamine methyltransferase [Jannaschia sp. S6380]
MTGVDVARAVAEARRRLDRAGVPDPGRDAQALLLAVAGREAAGQDTMSGRVAAAYDRAIARRERREPVSHITGRRAFWMHEFRVSGDVLDPRPETEALIEAAISVPVRRVLDLGTGSGCILLSILHEVADAIGVGTDISAAALDMAAQNADVVGVADRVSWHRSNWLADVTGTFDLIVSNPPYIATSEMADLAPEVREWEPRIALTPGGDGLDAYRIIARDAPAHLVPGGRLLLEIGHAQAAEVSALLRASGFEAVTVHPDLGGRDRVVSAEKCRMGARISL